MVTIEVSEDDLIKINIPFKIKTFTQEHSDRVIALRRLFQKDTGWLSTREIYSQIQGRYHSLVIKENSIYKRIVRELKLLEKEGYLISKLTRVVYYKDKKKLSTQSNYWRLK